MDEDRIALNPAETAELLRLHRSKLEHRREGHDREALQSLIDRGLVEPGLHNDLTADGERVVTQIRG